MFVIVCLTAVAFAACGSGGGDDGDAQNSGEIQTVSTDGSTSMEKVIGFLSEAYMDQNKNVKVTYRSSDLKEGQEAPKDKDGNKLDADRPINPPVIKSLRVETYGIDYGVPETNDVFDYYTWLMNTYYGQGA